MKILFISLGCDKNLVDSEVMLVLLTKHGYTLTDDETQADVIVINTCCFIHAAKEAGCYVYAVPEETYRADWEDCVNTADDVFQP